MDYSVYNGCPDGAAGRCTDADGDDGNDAGAGQERWTDTQPAAVDYG